MNEDFFFISFHAIQSKTKFVKVRTDQGLVIRNCNCGPIGRQY